ncbi:hypothetical protein [Pseudidiomarina marina]|uniref:Protease n=1 Tax=Pseudidiomarina marina TaxID=502366 RepID=A0A432YIZ6_9GAMM|nr:hypothetical protein [Pseudidiomarina marina]PHR65876.1 MAG: hypothetical protein COA51_03770 [Idiomarina sp.]RUO60947.1 hypothetical protein CWI76_01310 [Pseudidiomarina marina]
MLTTLKNIIVSHWRGDYSLGIAYWVIGVGLTVAVSILVALTNSFISSFAVSSSLFGSILVVLCSLIIPLTIWQLVGIWRSAKYHTSQGGRPLWANVVRVMVVLAAIRAVLDFTEIGIPQFQEGVDLMANGDTVGSFELRVLNEGKELELIGFIPFGTTKSIREVVRQYPAIEVIHLNSKGGRVTEAVQLYDYIQQQQFDTYVASECSSACTLAFMGGRNRYLSKRGILGFHSASLPSSTDNLAQLNDEFKRIYRRHGVSEQFIRQAIGIDGASMWYPGHLELLASRVIDEVVASDRFATSNAIQELQKTWQADHLQQAPDNALVNYWQTVVDNLNYLNFIDSQQCIQYLHPEWFGQPLALEKVLPTNLYGMHRQAIERVIEETDLQPDYQVKLGSIRVLAQNMLDTIARDYPNYPDVIAEPERYRDQPKLLCSALITLYETALRQETISQQAALLRYLAHTD